MGYSKAQTRMNILAIECSLPQASLCLFCEGSIIFSASWATERNHDFFLFPALREALDKLEGKSLQTILVGAGPGSYGGVRVALAAAVGISTVTGASTAALCSWEQFSDESAVMISDARRGGWTVRKHDGHIEVVNTDELLAIVQSGLKLHTIETSDTLAKHGITAEKSGLVPSAEGLIKTWLSMNDTRRAAAINAPAEPIYVRPPHITKALHKPWEIR